MPSLTRDGRGNARQDYSTRHSNARVPRSNEADGIETKRTHRFSLSIMVVVVVVVVVVVACRDLSFHSRSNSFD